MSPKPRLTLGQHPTDSEIAERAYNRWVARGRPIGDGREDWYAAEAELKAQSPAPVEPAFPRRRLRSALRRLGL